LLKNIIFSLFSLKISDLYYQLKKYLHYLLHSTNKHGIHSPFVFDLITKCFEKKTAKEAIYIFNEYKRSLKNNDSIIKVTDFGAGSKVFKTNQRKVAAILKNVTIENKEAYLLTRLVNYLDCTTILEIGTSLGVGTLALALGNKKATITTLEGCPETLKIPKTHLNKYIPNTIHFKEGEFSKTLTKIIQNKTFDLIYFDGNHQKEPTIKYFEQCLQTIHNKSVFIFDDIYWSKEMTEAWEYIKNHKQVTLTIDIYHLGFVFFRKEQFEKETFIIRF